MNRILTLKKFFAAFVLCCAAAGLSSGQLLAQAESDSVESAAEESVVDSEESDVAYEDEIADDVNDEDIYDFDSSEEDSSKDSSDTSASDETESVSDNTSDSEADSSDTVTSQTVEIDTSSYTDKLNEISEKKAELAEQIADADEQLTSEAEKQQLILEEISVINEKTEVLNSYITQLELEISTQTQKINEIKSELDVGIAQYKKRLRAMYIAGDTYYTEILLGAADFYDILMRSELLERVTSYDTQLLDSLVEKNQEYEEQMEQLEAQQAEYDEQSAELESERAELTELYNTSTETKALLEEEKEQLEQEQTDYDNEVASYEGILSDLLKGSYGTSDDEAQRLETEVSAAAALEQIYASIAQREADGEVVSDEECRYTFKWPVAGHYNVSSGVGERWGRYHKGLDITGESGISITAAEAGTVVRVNNSCTHNYGKTESCGCGGGYGNYVIIDHGNGFLTLYGHLTKATVEVGDTVKEGEEIGLMGSTGNSTGTHLHFELRYNGYVTNPATFVSY